MVYIKDIFKASVCSFCDNIYEYNSLSENKFVKHFQSYLLEEDLQSCLEMCTSEIVFDMQIIEKVCDELYLQSYKNFEIEDIIDDCKNAYLKTIEKDKTIDIKAFINNLSEVFSKK